VSGGRSATRALLRPSAFARSASARSAFAVPPFRRSATPPSVRLNLPHARRTAVRFWTARPADGRILTQTRHRLLRL